MISERNAKKFCCEDISRIENYDKAIADTTQTWDLHHRLEIQGPFTNSPELLKRCGMYYAVPASQLIFLTHGEHSRLHNMNQTVETRVRRRAAKKGVHFSEEHKRKLSAALKGRQLSEEHKQNMSAAQKGNTNVRGKKWFNNGEKSIMAFECPPGFVPGMLRKKK